MPEQKSVKDLGSKCEIGELLGSGSFGKVYKAVYREDGKTYAMKILKFTEDLHETYAVSEAAVQELMNHPNIVRLAAFEIDSANKRAFFLREYCRGGDLFSKLRKYRNNIRVHMPKERIRSYFMQLVFALHYMHDAAERGDKTKKGAYVHHDIKPENIFFADEGKTLIKIGDLGIAMYQPPGEKVSSTAGTWTYHAPEIFNEEPFDEKVDVWALGCVAYEILNNVSPFPVEVRRQMRMIHGSGSDYLEFGRDRDPELADLIERMLIPDPDKRISTAELLQQPMFREQRLETLLTQNNLEARTCRLKLEREREEHQKRSKRQLEDHKLELATQAELLRHLKDRGARMQEAERKNAAKLEQKFTVELQRRLAEQLALQKKTSQAELDTAYYYGRLNQQRRIEGKRQGIPAATGHARSPVKVNDRYHHDRENPMPVHAPVLAGKIKPLERNVHSDGDILKRSAYPLAIGSPEKAHSSSGAFHIKPLERNARSADASMWTQRALWAPQSARVDPKPAATRSTSWFRSRLNMLRRN